MMFKEILLFSKHFMRFSYYKAEHGTWLRRKSSLTTQLSQGSPRPKLPAMPPIWRDAPGFWNRTANVLLQLKARWDFPPNRFGLQAGGAGSSLLCSGQRC